MSGKGTYIVSAAVAACICLLLFIAPASGANIVIGGDYTDVGTIVFVSPKSGDPATTNGTALRNTLNGIIDASATNKYLIKLGPGIYDLGTTGLQMKQYVSMEGSGEKATKITAAVSSDSWPLTVATVMGANDAGLRSLTVENTGTGTFSAGILNSAVSPSLIHVTASASGGTEPIGVCNNAASPKMTNVTASASGGGYNHGVYNNAISSPVMTNVTATASVAGAYNYGVSNTNSSPTMTHVTASASGVAGVNYGVLNMFSSSPVMTNVTASASGGINNYGVWIDSIETPCSPTMTNVTASASGGTNSYGVRNLSCSPTLTNVTATASGGSGTNYGVYSLTSGTVRINHSVITGATNTIYNGSGVTTHVGNTQLNTGAVTNAGTLTCFGLYNENNIAYSCPP